MSNPTCSNHNLFFLDLRLFVDNEELMDLFCPNPEKKLKLFEDVKKGVMCLNLEEISVTNSKDILEMLQKGIYLFRQLDTLSNELSCQL